MTSEVTVPEAAIIAMLVEARQWDEGLDTRHRDRMYKVYRDDELISEHPDRASMLEALDNARARAALTAALPHLSIPSASSPIQGAVTDKEIEAVRAQLATVTRALTLLARAARSVFGALAPGESLAGDAGHTNHLIHLTNEADALVLSLAAAIPRPRSEAAAQKDAEAVAPIQTGVTVGEACQFIIDAYRDRDLIETIHDVGRRIFTGQIATAQEPKVVQQVVDSVFAAARRAHPPVEPAAPIHDVPVVAWRWHWGRDVLVQGFIFWVLGSHPPHGLGRGCAVEPLVRQSDHLAALTAANDRIAELERERDERQIWFEQECKYHSITWAEHDRQRDRAEAAEAELARLQSAQPAGHRPESEEAGRTLLNQEQSNGD